MTGYAARELREFDAALVDFDDSSQEGGGFFSELLGTFFLALVAAGGGMIRRAAALLGVARDVLPRSRGGGRRDDGTGVPGHDHAHRRCGRPRPDGDGDHPVHGQGLRRPPESRRERRVLAPGRLSVAPGTGLHRGPAHRRHARRAVPSRRDRLSGTYGSNYVAPGFSAGDGFLMEAVLTFGS